jgi:glycosyltransferase involved in cell wall biosynthesis
MSSVVSVVITTHYRNDTLPDAIESALAQSYDPVEVVVVDDSGEGHARRVVDDYDVGYVAHPQNRGQIAGWETGLEATDGEYVQFLDDDDWLDGEKVAAQVELLERDRSVGVAHCGMLFENGHVQRPDPRERGDVLSRALTLSFRGATTSTFLVERALLTDLVPLGDYDAGTDLVLAIELARRTEFDHVQDLLVYRGLSPDSQGHSLSAVDTRWRLIEEYADLYRDRPDEVRRRAVSSALRREGRELVRARGWSPAAPLNYARAARVDPDGGVGDWLRAAAALFGAPGFAVGRRVFGRIRAFGPGPRRRGPVRDDPDRPSFSYPGRTGES